MEFHHQYLIASSPVRDKKLIIGYFSVGILLFCCNSVFLIFKRKEVFLLVFEVLLSVDLLVNR